MSLSIQSQKKIRKMKAKWKLDSWEDYEEMEKQLTKKMLQSKDPTIKGSVRIIAGKSKNILLDIPRNTRPLTDRLKTTIFDVLGADIYNKNVLDLYAGTGSFGLEALSRGAKSATFVDAAKNCIHILNDNIEKTGSANESTAVREKVEDFLNNKKNLEETYDLIFLDPPYKKFNTKNVKDMESILNLTKMMLPGLKKNSRKKFKGALILKHPRKYPLEKLNLESLHKIETYYFGLNALSIFIVKE